WDLGDLPRGSSGAFTYQVMVTNVITTGFSFHNNAFIASAENDANTTNNTSSVTTVVTSNCIPPAVVSSPEDATICAGGTATFSVLANGSVPLTYQWRKNTVPIGGATSATLTASTAGSYDVLVSNLCGSVISASAALTVGGGPVID